MPPVGLEPTVSTGERPQTYTLDRPAINTMTYVYFYDLFYDVFKISCFI